jgi:hypothetical protein
MNPEKNNPVSGLDKIKALKQEQELKRQEAESQEKQVQEQEELAKSSQYQTEKEVLAKMTSRKDDISKRLAEIKSKRGDIIKTGHKAVEEARQDKEVEKILHTKEGFDEVFSEEKIEWKNLQEEVSNLNKELDELNLNIPEKEKSVNELFLQTKEGQEKIHEEKREKIAKELLENYYLKVDDWREGKWDSNTIKYENLRNTFKEQSVEEVSQLLKESVDLVIEKDPRGLTEETKKLLRDFVELRIDMTIISARAYNLVGNDPINTLEREKKTIAEQKKEAESLSYYFGDFKNKNKENFDQKVFVDEYRIMPLAQWEEYRDAEKGWGETSRNFMSKEDKEQFPKVKQELENHLKNKPALFGKEKWENKKQNLERQIAGFEDKEKAGDFYQKKQKLEKDNSGIEYIVRKIPGAGYDNRIKGIIEKIGLQNGMTLAEAVEKIDGYIETLKTKEFDNEKQILLDSYKEKEMRFEKTKQEMLNLKKK